MTDIDNIPLLIKRCLTLGVRIFPHQLYCVLKQYDQKRIPDRILIIMDADSLKTYVNGLYLSNQESAGDWTRGHSILKDLGFKEQRREEGHRCFVSLVWRK